MLQIETEGKERSYMVAWCTKFQLEIMQRNRIIACMDSTHKVVRPLMPDGKKVKDASALFTILVKDIVLHQGIPIAYLICNTESTFLLKKWLSWLKGTCQFKVSKLMMDCSPIETEANYQHVDTNNLLESWFHTLKSHYLDGKTGYRADVVISMLQGEIERDFKAQLLKVAHGVQAVKHSEYDNEREKEAMALDVGTAKAMVTENVATYAVCNNR
ncbi:hypothetical protein BGW38_007631 [Lunasporangiospora selenospora]|uniref:MULE transposase domain-containing protein n=1 Tax=Lunasporangiospora selenospora TaxID=979761 RepID=A0A9P6KGI0_9FUNG|nr:hypothetical protein BGW38_007631 [Lunasporangiospora selenospora]